MEKTAKILLMIRTNRKYAVGAQLTVGFALPTILISSIVMLIVLLSSVSAASGIRSALNEQYYNQLAKTAAESGLVRAEECLKQNNYSPTGWTDSLKLRPDTTCTGAQISGGNRYITSFGNIRTTFLVSAPQITASGDNSARLVVTGMTEILRSTNGSLRETFTQTASRNTGEVGIFSTDSSSGVEQTCGIINQETWCWGTGANGRLGNGSTASSTVPVKVSRQAGMLSGKVDTNISVGAAFACSVADNKAYCWGYNVYGQLGNGLTADTSVPVAVSTATGMTEQIKQVITGGEHACAVTIGGDVWCWGRNNYGQIGNGLINTTLYTQPVRVTGLGQASGIPVSQIAASIWSSHTCAIGLSSAGPKVYCWGRNDQGQVGNGTYSHQPSPAAVYDDSGLAGRTVTDIFTSSSQTQGLNGSSCAVASGRFYCWGNNSYGILGNGTTNTSNIPVAVITSGALSGKTALEVNMGINHACGTARDSSFNIAVYCWGYNNEGQLGNNTYSNSTVPVAVYVGSGGLLGKKISALKGGGNRGCVIADQTTLCWGYNYAGQLGDGTTTTRNVPTVASYLQQRLPTLSY